jgi:hypothetical protein
MSKNKKQSNHYAKSVKSGNKIKSSSISKKSSSSSSKSTRSNSPTKKSKSPSKKSSSSSKKSNSPSKKSSSSSKKSSSSSKTKKLQGKALKKKKTRRIKRGTNFSWGKYMLIGLASLGRQMVNKEPEKFKDFPHFDMGNNTVYEFPINDGPASSFSGKMTLNTGLMNKQPGGRIILSKLPYETSKTCYDGRGGYVGKRRKTKRKTKRRKRRKK